MENRRLHSRWLLMQIQKTARQSPEKQPIREAKGKVSPFKAQALMSPADNLEFMAPLRGNSMKLIVTSPPYNIGKSYEKRSSLELYLENQAKVIAECVRLLHPQGSICWQVGNHVDKGEVVPLDTVLYPIFKQHGLKLR